VDYVEQLLKAYVEWDRTKAKNPDTWAELIADDIVWHSLPGVVPGLNLHQPLQGKDAVALYFAALDQHWEMVEYKVDHLIAQEGRVAMLGSCAWRSRKTGQVVETPKADFFHFRGGKIVEFWEFYDTAKTIAGQRAAEG
jgi:ketosteroid isomerase-like protein